MASLEDIQSVKGLLGNIENILKHLSGLEYASVDNLNLYLTKIKSLVIDYNNLNKYTYQGKFSPALRLKLKKLIAWKNNVDSLLEKEVRMKKNKDFMLDRENVDKYVDYIEKSEYFMESFPSILKDIKKNIDSLYKGSSYLKNNLDKFKMQESDIATSDLLKAEDEEVTAIEPIKTLSAAKSSINEFARVIKKVKGILSEINLAINECNNYSVEDVLSALNKKNLLVKNLFLILNKTNRILSTTNISGDLSLRQKYNQLLAESIKYLPPGLINKFTLDTSTKSKSRIENITDSSIGVLKDQIEKDKIKTDKISPWGKVDVPSGKTPFPANTNYTNIQKTPFP